MAGAVQTGLECTVVASRFQCGTDSMRFRPVILCVFLLAGCVAAERNRTTYRTASPGSAAGVVFIANGAGDFGTVSQSFIRVVRENSLPLELDTVEWSLGYRH